MAAAVVAHHGADALRQLAELRQQFFERHLRDLRVLLGHGVEIGDVSGVMLAVMDLHGAGVDRGFERVGRIGQGILAERAGRRRRGLGQDDTRRKRRGGDSCSCVDHGSAGEAAHGVLLGLFCAATRGRRLQVSRRSRLDCKRAITTTGRSEIPDDLRWIICATNSRISVPI